MRKITIIAFGILTIFAIVFACTTKEIKLITNVELDFSQESTNDGFVQELLPITLTITPEVFLPEFNYFFQYEVLEGDGNFLDANGEVLPSGEPILLERITEEDTNFILALNYQARNSGIHKVQVTASDNFEKSFSEVLLYNIQDIPVVWELNLPLSTADELQEIPMTLTLEQITEDTDISYEVRYNFNEGSGQLLDEAGNNITLNRSIPITPGVQNLTLIANQIGAVSLQAELIDSNGQSIPTTLSLTILELDRENPVITLLGANPMIIFTGATYVDPGVTLSDNRDSETELRTTLVVDESEVDTSVAGQYEVTYTVSDKAENSATAIRIVNIEVNATDVPQFSVKGNSTANTDAFDTLVELGDSYTLGTIDGLSDNGQITAQEIEDASNIGGTTPSIDTYTVIYTATDNDGNTTTLTETVLVNDTTPPAFSILGNSISFSTPWQAGVVYNARAFGTITDASTTETTIDDPNAAIGTALTTGTYEITYTVTDAVDLEKSITETVLVTDGQQPAFEVRTQDNTIQTASFTTALEFGTEYIVGTIQNITDNSGAANTTSTIVYSDGISTNSSPAISTTPYTVTYTVSDTDGNSKEIVETITVEDTTVPSFSVDQGAQNYTANFTTAIAFGGSYTAGTIKDPSDLSDFTTEIMDADKVDTTTEGTYTVQYIVTDNSPNANQKIIEESVTVGPNNTPATAVNDENIEIQQNTASNPFSILIPVTANDMNPDNLGLTVTVAAINTPANGTAEVNGVDIRYTPNQDYLGNDSFIYTLTDSDNNPPTQARVNILIQDQEIPVITLNGPSSSTVELNVGTYTEQGANVTDNQPLTQTTATVGGDTVDRTALNTYTINYTATDNAGNPANPVIRTVVVEDTQQPIITRTGPETVDLFVGGTYTEQGATVTDNNPATTTTAVVGGDTVNTNTAGTYIVRYTKSDPSGNTAVEVTRTVNVNRRPLAVDLRASPTSGAPPLNVDFTTTVTNANGPITYSWNIGGTASTNSQNYTTTGSRTVTVTVTAGGETQTDSVTITVRNSNPPNDCVITCAPGSRCVDGCCVSASGQKICP